MELILIDQTKLKIMLTAPDMTHYELNPERLEGMACTDRHTRAAFRHIFDDAEAQTGFHTAGERLLVQMYTSKCGGCEIFVTKLASANIQPSEDIPAPSVFDTPLTSGEAALIRQALACDETLDEVGALTEEEDAVCDRQENSEGKNLMPREVTLRRILLTVADMEALLAVCHRLKGIGYTGHSMAYIEEERAPARYHLYLEVPDGVFYLLPENYAFLKEYGEVSRQRHMELYLEEHARLLCARYAVETLGCL